MPYLIFTIIFFEPFLTLLYFIASIFRERLIALYSFFCVRSLQKALQKGRFVPWILKIQIIYKTTVGGLFSWKGIFFKCIFCAYGDA